MSRKMVERLVIVYQVAGFSLIVVLLWIDEVFDLPYRLFGAQATPINWTESIIETLGILILAVVTITISARNLKKIKYLEGFLPVCAFCKRIRVGGEWIPIEVYLSDHAEVTFSHGFCPECREKHYSEFPGEE